MEQAKPWLWPDHPIGKKESRTLREEHNQAVNQHAELLSALRVAVRLYETLGEDGNYKMVANDSECGKWISEARAAIAKVDKM
jgi:hypothetical protein